MSSVDAAAPRSATTAVATTTIAAIAGGAFLLPATPALVVELGGTVGEAGLVAALFMATAVAGQLGTARLVAVVDYSGALLLGVILLSVPCLLALGDSDLRWWYAISGLRGFGFGVLTVVSTAVPALLSQRETLGRVYGLQGLVLGLCQVVALPGGILLLTHLGPQAAVLVAALIPIVGLGAWPILARHRSVVALTHQLRPPRGGGRLLAAACFLLAGPSLAYGAITTLMPIATEVPAELVLAVVAGALALGRYQAGVWADRYGPGNRLRAMMVIGGLGIALVSLSVVGADPGHVFLIITGSALYGFGFGAVQTDTVLIANRSCGPSHVATASVWWNVSTDAATGLGSVIFALLAATATLQMAMVGAASCMILCAGMPFANRSVLEYAAETERPES